VTTTKVNLARKLRLRLPICEKSAARNRCSTRKRETRACINFFLFVARSRACYGPFLSSNDFRKCLSRWWLSNAEYMIVAA